MKKRFVGVWLDVDLYQWLTWEEKKRRCGVSQVLREAVLEAKNNSSYSDEPIKKNGKKKKRKTRA